MTGSVHSLYMSVVVWVLMETGSFNTGGCKHLAYMWLLSRYLWSQAVGMCFGVNGTLVQVLSVQLGLYDFVQLTSCLRTLTQFPHVQREVGVI